MQARYLYLNAQVSLYILHHTLHTQKKRINHITHSNTCQSFNFEVDAYTYHTIVFHRYKTPPKLSLNVKVTVKFLIYGIPQENPKTNEARVIIMSPGFENRGN